MNNQYIRREIGDIEEIREYKISINRENKRIEELEIGDKPNILICCEGEEGERKIRYENIYPSVRIIITDRDAIDNRWEEIPEYVEYVVVIYYRYFRGMEIIRNTRNKYDFIEYNEIERQKRIIREMIEEGRINEINQKGESILYTICKMKMRDLEEEGIGIIERVDKGIINHKTRNNNTIIQMAVMNSMERIAERLIEYTTEENINHRDKIGRSILWMACFCGLKSVIRKIIGKTRGEIIEEKEIKLMPIYILCQYGDELKEEIEIVMSKMRKESIIRFYKEVDYKMDKEIRRIIEERVKGNVYI